jgi:hypothetical protein
MSDSEGGSDPKQVSDPDYHSENHTAAQTCGWTKNALRGEGKCYKHIFRFVEQAISLAQNAVLPAPWRWGVTRLATDLPAGST